MSRRDRTERRAAERQAQRAAKKAAKQALSPEDDGCFCIRIFNSDGTLSEDMKAAAGALMSGPAPDAQEEQTPIQRRPLNLLGAVMGMTAGAMVEMPRELQQRGRSR